MALGRFLLWHLANFRCGTWPIFVVALGYFSSWCYEIISQCASSSGKNTNFAKNIETDSAMPTMNELYEWMPNLKAHHEAQIDAVRRMQEKPVDWDEIRKQINEDRAVLGLVGPYKRN